MTRWLVLTLFGLALGIALYQVRRFDGPSTTRDEVLAYEVTSDQGVELPIHAGIGEVTVATWPVVSWGTAADTTIEYGVDVLLYDSHGDPVDYRRYNARSRVTAALDSLEPSARLADASALVGGSRALEVDVSKLRAEGGTMKISAVQGANDRVLLLATHKIRRAEIEQTVLERSIDPRERTRLIGQRSSLGFFDLPAATRLESVAFRTRRLTALGSEGTSYTSRRLLLGEEAETLAEQTWHSLRTPVGPFNIAALNVTGSLGLQVVGEPDLALLVRDGATGKETRHVFPDDGLLKLEFQSDQVRSIFVRAERRTEVALSISEEHKGALIGERVWYPSGERIPFSPEVTRTTYYQLDPVGPVVYSMLPGQAELGLRLRLKPNASNSTAPSTGQVELAWRDKHGGILERGKLRFRAPTSPFDTFDGAPVTDAQGGVLRPPQNAALLALSGSSGVAVSLTTDEPGVEQSTINPAYDLALGESMTFRNAPFSTKNWAVIAPDNKHELESSGRAPRLHAQVRIEETVSAGIAIEERVLTTKQDVRSRYVFTPTTYAPRFAFPTNAWTPLGEEERLVTVPETGRLELIYIVDPEMLGNPWSLFSHGHTPWRSVFDTSAAHVFLPLAPGEQRLRVDGAGPGGSFVVRAPPTVGGKIFKRQRAYALPSQAPLKFEFERRADELLSIVLWLATPDGNQDVGISYRITSRVSGERPVKQLFRRLTAPKGKLRLRTGTRGRALIWSAEGRRLSEQLPDRVGSVIVPLGDDMPVGTHVLELRRSPEMPAADLWLRAIVVGQRTDAKDIEWIDAGPGETRRE